MSKHDIDLMQHADGELDNDEIKSLLDKDPDARAKADSLGQMHEIVRGHLEMSADAIPERRFDTMWREISRTIDVEQPVGMFARVRSWFDRHRGHVFTGMVSAGAVAALALILRGGGDQDASRPGAIDVQPAALRPTPVIEDLETPGGNSTVLNIKDDDGNTTVIVVTPADTVEGI
jgi:hypothetical protein